MPIFEVVTKVKMNLNGEFIDKGLSIQISTFHSNPFEEIDKINKAFIRVHGLDFNSAGYLNLGFFEFRKM